MNRWRPRFLFCEGLDNDQGGTAGLAGVGGSRLMIVTNVCFCAGIDGVIAQELSQSLHLFDPHVVGEESVVTDAVEA